MKKFYAILNALLIIAIIVWNYSINVHGIKGNTIREISNQYHTFFTPASYAFSIWGIIFLGLIALAAFQLYRVYSNHRDSEFVLVMGPWLLVANVMNGLWSYLFLRDETGLSVIVLCILLLSLGVIVVKLKMQQYDASFPILALVWWPIGIYVGWVTVASIANVGAYLSKIGFENLLLNDSQFSITMIVLAVIINISVVRYRNMREFGLVGVWSLVAIAVKQWGDEPLIVWHAIFGALAIFITVSFHAYSHRNKSPLIKFREWKKIHFS